MEKITKIAREISEIDYSLMEKTQKRLDSLTKPLGSLGRLEELAKLCAGITGKESLVLKNKVIFTFAADHGVTEEGVSAFPKTVTAQMVYNFLNEGAAINVLARHIGARVVVADLGVAERIVIRTPKHPFDSAQDKQNQGRNKFYDKKITFGTKNMRLGPAMTKEEAVKSIKAGMDIFENEFKSGVDIIGIGEMGIGNTTAASAIAASFTRKNIEDITDRGTGIDDIRLKNKIDTIKAVLKLNNPDPGDTVDVLSKVGGFEIGGLAGVILCAAAKKIPIVIDGFISGAAALIAFGIEPKIKQYLIAGHCSVERGHRIILDHLGIKPVFDLSLRLGEGTGAALGINLTEAAVKILSEMATFESAGVDKRE